MGNLNRNRVCRRMDYMRNITDAGEGITRLAFSDADWQGRAYLMQCMEEAGLTLSEDAFGNVLGRRAGKDDSLPAVMIGSHGDSVPHGGNYDGLVGIVSAIEIAQAMKEDRFENERPLAVALFMCEESSRFNAATMGSKVMRGKAALSDLHRLRDKNGISLYDALKGRGLHPDRVESAVYTQPLAAMLEMHIEQGKYLEHARLQVGVVTGIAAPIRLQFHVRGQADHSGATPMPLRHDALCGAAEIILHLEKTAKEAVPAAVGTVGVIEIEPGAMNVIPGEVRLGVDIRGTDGKARNAIAENLCDFARDVCQKRGLVLQADVLTDDLPVPIGKDMVDFLSSCCEAEGVSYTTMMSGAGHDAMHWADYCPTGMLFIPCKDGISHSPAEYAGLDDIMAGMAVAERAVRRLTKKDVRIGR